MPIYEYRCDQCDTVTDLKHGFREDPPTTTCPACGHSPLRRVFNAAGIVFKGSGFYVNDSRSTSSGSSSGGEKKSTPASPASGGGSSSDAPAAKSEKSEKSEKKAAGPGDAAA